MVGLTIFVLDSACSLNPLDPLFEKEFERYFLPIPSNNTLLFEYKPNHKAFSSFSDLDIGIIKVATNKTYLQHYWHGILNAIRFSTMYQHRFFIALQREEHMRECTPHFLKVQALHDLISLYSNQLDYVLYLDLDAWFDSKNNQTRISDYITRGQNKELILQSETFLCSCVMIFRVSPFVEQFLLEWNHECASSYTKVHPFEQSAWYHVMMRHMDGIDYDGHFCIDQPMEGVCQRSWMMTHGYKEQHWEEYDWTRHVFHSFGFIPNNGTKEEPQLTQCFGGWFGCLPNPGLILHGGHWFWDEAIAQNLV